MKELITRGHLIVDITTKKILNTRYWLPTLFKDASNFNISCDTC